ncbi:MAG TPA: hypothetical protein VN420_04265 [Candidatus Fimivivens sp.]|nr:hypothetical protein [Candidatus Fimivivens sp.]
MTKAKKREVPRTIGEYCRAMYSDRQKSELPGIIGYYEGIEKSYRENPGGPIIVRLPISVNPWRRDLSRVFKQTGFRNNYFVLAYCPENSCELGMEFGKYLMCGFRLLGNRYETYVNRIPGRQDGVFVEDTDKWKERCLAFDQEAIGFDVFQLLLSKLLHENVISGEYLEKNDLEKNDLGKDDVIFRGISFGTEARALFERLSRGGTEDRARERLFHWVPPSEVAEWQRGLIARYEHFSGTPEELLTLAREGDVNGRDSNPLLRFPMMNAILEAADVTERKAL